MEERWRGRSRSMRGRLFFWVGESRTTAERRLSCWVGVEKWTTIALLNERERELNDGCSAGGDDG